MELAKLLIKITYLIIIFGICLAVTKYRMQTFETTNVIICFLLSVLIVYFTFEYVYNFLVNSEIIFKKKNKVSKDVNNDLKDNKEQKKNAKINALKPNHTHNFIQNKIFA